MYSTLFKNNRIVNIDNNNLKNFTKNSVMLFYAEWCGHCKNYIPEYTKLPYKINKINFTAVDGDLKSNRNILQKYNIEGFPTMLYFNNKGQYKEYNGNKSIVDIKSFINSTNTKSKKLSKKSDIKKRKSSKKKKKSVKIRKKKIGGRKKKNSKKKKKKRKKK